MKKTELLELVLNYLTDLEFELQDEFLNDLIKLLNIKG
jgi:hypothetical protein